MACACAMCMCMWLTSEKAVEPRRPYSSPDHEQSTSERRGLHPLRRSVPSPLATSSSCAVPELGSAAP